MKQTATWILPLFLVLAAGCGSGEHAPAAPAEPAPAPTAVAELAPTEGHATTGTATFTDENGVVTLTVELRNATPGTHAVHIHEFGDCSAPDGSSAGGHWNPTNEMHGKWGSEHFHLGDIGNVEVGEDGTGSLTMNTDLWSIGGPENDVVGKSIIVHAGADDFSSQPAGNAGPRVACGVIEQQG